MQDEDEIARLVAAGRARPATLDLLDVDPEPGPLLSNALDEIREERLA